MCWSVVLIELLTRLGAALLLSLSLALLMAWGWSQTDAASSAAQEDLNAVTALAAAPVNN
jgi:hypothetical protein